MNRKNERVMRFDNTIAENRYDELYKERQVKRQSHVFSTPFIGTCMDKCPEFERHERELHLDLSIFEMVLCVCMLGSLLLLVDSFTSSFALYICT